MLPTPSLRLLRAAQVAETRGHEGKMEWLEAGSLPQEPLLRPTPKHSQEDAQCCVPPRFLLRLRRDLQLKDLFESKEAQLAGWYLDI